MRSVIWIVLYGNRSCGTLCILPDYRVSLPRLRRYTDVSLDFEREYSGSSQMQSRTFLLFLSSCGYFYRRGVPIYKNREEAVTEVAGGSAIYHSCDFAGTWGFKEYRMVTKYRGSNVLGRKVRRILP